MRILGKVAQQPGIRERVKAATSWVSGAMDTARLASGVGIAVLGVLVISRSVRMLLAATLDDADKAIIVLFFGLVLVPFAGYLLCRQ